MRNVAQLPEFKALGGGTRKRRGAKRREEGEAKGDTAMGDKRGEKRQW